MESADEKRPVQSVVFSILEGESTTTRLHRQLSLLEYKVEKHFRDADETLKMCERALEELETSKLRMKEKYELAIQNAARKLKLFLALKEMKEKVRRMEMEKAASSLELKMPDAAQNALRYTTSARV